MTVWNRGIGLATGIWALALAAPVGAQENLDSGKTGAQLFAANCAVCHKNAQALNRSGGLFGLSGFLREHYTSSRETAATIATYLESLGPAPGKRTGATKRTARGKAKGEPKTTEPKSGDARPSEPKAKDAKPSASKPADAKTSKPKSDAKPDTPAKSD